MKPKYPHVKVDLEGEDGHAYAIEEIAKFSHEAMSRDYGHLLRTCRTWFGCSGRCAVSGGD